MKKNIFFSTIAVMAIATVSYAGGDFKDVPDYVPVTEVTEPVEVEEKTTSIYLGAGLVRGRFFSNDCRIKDKACSYEDVTYGVLLRGGYDFNEYFGMETRVLGTFWDKGPLGGETLQHMGIYAKPMIPVSEKANIYALLGLGWTKSNTDDEKELTATDESGFSAGLGFEYDFETENDKEWGLFIDYQRLLIASDVPDMDVISAGILFDF